MNKSDAKNLAKQQGGGVKLGKEEKVKREGKRKQRKNERWRKVSGKKVRERGEEERERQGV